MLGRMVLVLLLLGLVVVLLGQMVLVMDDYIGGQGPKGFAG